jgi:type II secretory pathway pseudopilin PulG
MALAESSCRRTDERGFSLIETMLATMLLATGVLATAQMFIVATRSNMAAQRGTFTATLAQEKMEQLRGLSWGFDPVGLPISDYTTNVAVNPATADGVGLSPSPANALSANVDGYVDYVDRFGRSLGGGAVVPPNAVYVRRWSIDPLPSNPNNTLILQVLAFAAGDRDPQGDGAVLNRTRDEARIISVKARKSR